MTTEKKFPKFTKADVLKALEQVVQERGEDYTYNQEVENPGGQACVYTNKSGEASCIVGKALDIFGLERPQYGARENGRAFNAEEFPTLVSRLTKGAYMALRRAQAAQDAGRLYSTVLARAKEPVRQ